MNRRAQEVSNSSIALRDNYAKQMYKTQVYDH